MDAECWLLCRCAFAGREVMLRAIFAWDAEDGMCDR